MPLGCIHELNLFQRLNMWTKNVNTYQNTGLAYKVCAAREMGSGSMMRTPRNWRATTRPATNTRMEARVLGGNRSVHWRTSSWALPTASLTSATTIADDTRERDTDEIWRRHWDAGLLVGYCRRDWGWNIWLAGTRHWLVCCITFVAKLDEASFITNRNLLWNNINILKYTKSMVIDNTIVRYIGITNYFL